MRRLTVRFACVEPLIRPAVAEEMDALLDLWHVLEESQREFRIFPMGDRPEDKVRALFQSAFDEPDFAAVFVAVEDDELRGMALVFIQDLGRMSLSGARVAELSKVVVVKEARSQRIGRALVDAAAEFGRRRGATYLTAKIFSENRDAIAFWERVGFVPRYEERVRPI